VKTQQAEVVAIRHLAPDVRELVLQPLEEKVSFKPGQWISVHLPVGEKPLVRAYTMAEPESDDGTLVLCFDRVKEGAASNYLFSIDVGTRFPITAALGNFTLPDPLDKALAFVTWFTGIVPIHCMLTAMERRGLAHRTVLLYGAPNADELVYHAQLQEMSARHPWLEYHPIGNTPGEDRSVEDVLTALPGVMEKSFSGGPGPDQALPMLCGIRAVVLPAREWFMQEKGFARQAVRKETYD
jgi:ferredoxin-NADP reductase